MELWEACRYGLVGQVHYLLTSGVNVNMTNFVSDEHDMNFDCRFSVLSQYCSPLMHRIMSHETYPILNSMLQSWIKVVSIDQSRILMAL